MSKVNVVLFMGGDSGEYEVSIASSAQVKNNLDPEKYDVYPVLIHKGSWYYTATDGTQISFDRNDHGLHIGNEIIKFDCAFIAIHGTPGEDGKLQGYLDLAGIPYTTCDVTTSALTFNKYFSNDLAKQYGVMSIPANFLLDKEGKIIGSGLRGEDLVKKLEEVLGK